MGVEPFEWQLYVSTKLHVLFQSSKVLEQNVPSVKYTLCSIFRCAKVQLSGVEPEVLSLYLCVNLSLRPAGLQRRADAKQLHGQPEDQHGHGERPR